ncbi:GtrA family protein [Candidatus Peregrinibacteria bacterium]|nr:GtrA family protein [Candidatus Peregrinibacteria bacterium]
MSKLIIKYSAFALIAIFGNIIVQFMVFNNYTGPYQLLVAMACGTVASLFIKYFLDKKFIFYFNNKRNNIYNFALYSFNGVFTTLIFWGIETAFYIFLPFGAAKYIGAFIGLCICYVIKYHLDKRFVFVEFPYDKLPAFEDIGDILDMTVILDIDGTIVADNCDEIAAETMVAVETLKKHNTVYLCTNSFNRIRNAKVEKLLGLKIADMKHKKPSKKILETMFVENPSRLVVIGDKFLTDGLFAKRIGAQFLMVKRKLSFNEPLLVKVINFIDGMAYHFAYLSKK